MDAILSRFRYFVFGLFLVCHAIIASLSVWNLSLTQNTSIWNSQFDAYLIFVGAFGLVLIIPVIFLELANMNTVIGRVWFELTWVAFFWAFNLAGAAALSTTIAQSQSCGVTILDLRNLSCTSRQVLLAFIWMNAITLLVYLLLLATSVLSYQKRDPTIWHCSVRRLPWLGGRSVLSSAPVSPVTPGFAKQTSPSSIAAPRARRPVNDVIYGYRSGLSLEYEIEHYQPSNRTPNRTPNNARVVDSSNIVPSSLQSSLYPQYMQNVLIANPPPAAFHESTHPQPLGDWPRADIISRPPRSKPKKPPALHPAGPRVRSNSSDSARPPPLDLSSLSTFQAPDRRNL